MGVVAAGPGYGLAALLSIAPARNQGRACGGGCQARERATTGRTRHIVDRSRRLRLGAYGAEDAGSSRRTRWVVRPPAAASIGARRFGSSARSIAATGFLVSCRAVEAVAWYTRGRRCSRSGGPERCSSRATRIRKKSDSSPRRGHWHSAGVRLSRLSDAVLTAARVHAVDSRRGTGGGGEAAQGTDHGRGAPRGHRGRVGALWTRDVSSAPTPVIGIFPPKALSWTTLAAIIEDCRAHFRARQIVIRWHPSMLESPRLSHRLADLSGIIEYPGSAPFHEIARQCDWVIAAENSNVHLPAAQAGHPHRRRQQPWPLSEEPLRSVRIHRARHRVSAASNRSATCGRTTFAAFFSDCWVTRFKQYDASYLLPAGRDRGRGPARDSSTALQLTGEAAQAT